VQSDTCMVCGLDGMEAGEMKTTSLNVLDSTVVGVSLSLCRYSYDLHSAAFSYLRKHQHWLNPHFYFWLLQKND
jgi:hypothetical protein